MLRLINTRKVSDAWNHKHIGSLSSAVCNRQWPQARLDTAGMAPQRGAKACRLCVAHNLCEWDSQDSKFLGTLTHRLWTCPVLEPKRRECVPGYLLRKVSRLLRPDDTLPPSEVLLYTRALHRSIEPLIRKAPCEATFEWHVKPHASGVPPGRVYADGSRLFAEHKYCDLVYRQGWAFAVISDEGIVVASASGNTPWWAVGIHAAELWALLNASLTAHPGCPFFIDCKAVQLGTRNGSSWMTAPSRKFGRAWSPLSVAFDENSELVHWMPAHCTAKSVGYAHLSDGSKMTHTDLESNDLVDALAKAQARKSPPTLSERSLIVTTSDLVTDIARWIGVCTEYANHFPMRSPEGGLMHVRDSQAKKKVYRPRIGRNIAMGVADCSATVPSPCWLPSPGPSAPESSHSVLFPKVKRGPEGLGPDGSRPFKRPRTSERQVENRSNAMFREHWRASRDQRVQLVAPPISAADRLQAMRDRILSRKKICVRDGSLLKPVA